MENEVAANASEPSFDETAYTLLKALTNSNYFGSYLPTAEEISIRTHLPQSAVEDAMLRLENDDLVDKTANGYERIILPNLEKRGTVAFLLNSDIFADWYGIYQDYLIGFEEALRSENYDVIFRSGFGTLENKLEAIREFQQAGVSGLAFASFAEQKVRYFVREAGIPSIGMGNATIHQQDIACVCNDNQGLMSEVVRFLVENGHRKIAYYTVQARSHDGFQDRLVGYELGMKKAGLAPMNELVFTEKHSEDIATRAAEAFRLLSPRPSAVICASDREACELIARFEEMEIPVPNEVSVTGVDSSTFGAMSSPPLTSVEMHAPVIGRVAAHYLLNIMNGETFPLRLMIPAETVIRESVVALPDTPHSVSGRVSKKTSRIVVTEEDDMLLENF